MFLSHKNSIKDNEYIVLEQFDKERILTKNGDFKMVSNICPHQKSFISENVGAGDRSCPYHGWTFSSKGEPINSGATGNYCTNDKSLKNFPVFEWSDLLFDTEVNFKETIDLSNLILVEKRIDIVKSSFKNIMDIFLDVDHIPIVHKDVYESIGFETVDDVEWIYYENGSVQKVQNRAMWIAIYPNTMIEWQLGNLFVTVAKEKEKNVSEVLVFKYRDKNSSEFEWHQNELVWETAWRQDKEQAERMSMINNSNQEEQKVHFTNWLQDNGFKL